MNYSKGFITPLLFVLISILLIGGAYVYVQQKQANPPVVENVALPIATSTVQASGNFNKTQTTGSQTEGWKTYTRFSSEFSFKYPPRWHVTEYTRNEAVVAIKFIPSQTNGTDINADGSFSFDPKDDPDYIVVYREFAAQPECAFLTQQTSQVSESGNILNNPEWPNAKCIEPFDVKSSHYLPYAVFTPSKNLAILGVYNQLLSTFKSNQ